MKNSQLAENFAEGETKGNGNNMFIEGNTIYSYGHHFPIAVKMKDGSCIFNADGYSVTTSKHKGYVRRALESRGIHILEKPTERLIEESKK